MRGTSSCIINAWHNTLILENEGKHSAQIHNSLNPRSHETKAKSEANFHLVITSQTQAETDNTPELPYFRDTVRLVTHQIHQPLHLSRWFSDS